MLTLDKRGLLFGGKHVLAPVCPETGRLDIDTHLEPVLVQLSAGFMRPMDERTVSFLKSAVRAWNRGDAGRAAYDLIQVRLPDPKDDAGFNERIDLVGKALADGHSPHDIMKTFGGSLAWIGEARVPAGNGHPLSGEWTADGSASGNIVDIGAHSGKKPRDLCANRVAVGFVKKYRDEAFAVAAQYGVRGEDVLGLAARESGYGQGGFMRNDEQGRYSNAFFNLQKDLREGHDATPDDWADMPYATNMLKAGQAKDGGKKRAWVYTYGSFTDAAKSMLEVYGNRVRGAASPDVFLSRLKAGGFNTGSKFLDPEVLTEAAKRLKCPN